LFGESRWSIVSLIVFFVVGMILLSFVDVQKGVEAAQATAA
jgi:MFS-type transporter involved in bile tolerance (Atg22 family)